jgi:hypothetical protein
MRSGPICFGDRTQSGLKYKDRTVLRSSPKIRDRTAYKSVRSGLVPVPRSGPVSLEGTDDM